MSHIVRIPIYLGSVMIYYFIERYLGLLDSLLSSIHPSLTDMVLTGIVSSAIIASIYEWRINKDSTKHGSQKHTDDLKRVYDRLVSIRADDDGNGNLVFTVPPPRMDMSNTNHTTEESKQKILEHASTPWTELKFVNSDDAFDHLKKYKKINKHWKKSQKSFKKYNDNKNESEKQELNKHLKNFRQELLTLVDRIDNGHTPNGKCTTCP